MHDDLRRRLDGSEFGDLFPSELTLVTSYGVSRQTVRQALRQLRAEGVVTAERGRAPRVAPVADIRQPLGALYSLFASVEAQGLEQRSVVRVLEIRAAPAVAERLGLLGSTEMFYLERLRLAGDHPLALDATWLPADVARPLLTADFTHGALYDLLSRQLGFHLDGGSEHIRAVVPTAEQKQALGLDDGVAAFSIHRVGRSAGRPVEWRETLVRADRFSLTAEFSARTGYQLDVGPVAGAPARTARARGRAPLRSPRTPSHREPTPPSHREPAPPTRTEHG